MRTGRTVSMIVIALLAGMAAVYFAARWLQLRSHGNLGRIAVAATDINLGQPLNPQMIEMIDWPTASRPPGYFDDPQRLAGRVLKTSVARGEPLMESKLAPEGTKGGLSAVIGEGKRAMTVRVNDVIGVAGFALPGNYVDIIVSTQKDGKRGDTSQAISKIVLERILVLAVAQEVNRDDTKPKVVKAVTLEVSPAQAEKLDLARSVGTLSLVLRNQIDPDPGITAGATKRSLLDEPQAKPTKVAHVVRQRAPARPKPTCVGLIAGIRDAQECY